MISQYLNLSKVKYEILKPIIDNNITSGRFINIYIDLETVLSPFYSKSARERLMHVKYPENIHFTSEIINIAAHYRNFFWTRYKVPSKIFLFYGNGASDINKEIVPTYNDKLLYRKSRTNIHNNYINDLISDNMNLINTIIPFIPEVYFIYSRTFETSLIPYHLINSKMYNQDDRIHLIMTNDKYNYQFVNCPNTFVLKLRSDKSGMLTKDNLIDYMCSTSNYTPDIVLNSELYSFILSIVGVDTRNIEGVKGLGYIKSIKLLEKLIKEKRILNKHTIDPSYILKEMDLVEFSKLVMPNFSVIDLKYQYLQMKSSEKIFIEDCLIDKYDNQSIMNLNSQYFEDCNIQLIELEKGVSI